MEIVGLNLPNTYEVRFSNTDEVGTAKTAIATSHRVVIPDEFLADGRTIYAWVFTHAGESDGETVWKVIIPVNRRAKPTNAAPTPVQQDVITQTIAALNDGLERAVDEGV